MKLDIIKVKPTYQLLATQRKRTQNPRKPNLQIISAGIIRNLPSYCVDKDVEKSEDSYYTAGGDEDRAAALENNLAVPQNIKYKVIIQPTNSTPKYIPNGIKNIHPHKNSHMNAYSNNLPNS